MDTKTKKTSVLLFPWVAYGHISPFTDLGFQLEKRNFKVYLCSTPANLSSIRKKLGEESSIQLVELHLENLPNLPAEYHTTNGLPPYLMDTLKSAFDGAEPKFSNILQTVKPDLLIYDFMRPWPAEAASRLNIPAVQFIATSSTMTSYMLHVYERPGLDFPFSKIFYHDYESVHGEKLKIKSVENDLVMKSLYRSTKIILIKGFKEMDGKYSNYLSGMSGKKIVQVGPLVQRPRCQDEDCEIIMNWLNKKEPSSTIFVSFGSEYFLSEEDFQEIAQGLLLANVNFIWVVRFPVGENIRLAEKLPSGFLEKVGDRGKVVEGWAPQSKILEHSSTGGFVSHCGWNSVNESMYFGVPIIAMPMHLDQPINAKLVEEIGIGVEVVRDTKGKLEREEIAAVINHVVVEKDGEVVRKKAKELKANIKMRGEQEIDEMVKELKQICHENKDGLF
ncbi:Glycosyltransferase [Heracleum sosnowskyi]|uniref:Glycosyltransferase n=1 Tax=Heracleum sosnowskyi TaxID=360622 RepID=A0AAD8MLI0_9APIA|nr:Glycosyltransferase [Heracleum sosnowskyi]